MNEMKTNMVCNAIKVVAGCAVIGYACKVTRSAWPLLGLMFIPQSSYTRNSDPVGAPVVNKDEDVKEDKNNE